MNKYIIIIIILGLINSILSSNLHTRDFILSARNFIDDESDIIPKECKYAITYNLDIMNNCIQLLQDKTIEEEEFKSMCESFEDYYAQDTESETEDEDDTSSTKPVIELTDLTKEEEEALNQVNKVINDYIDKSETKQENEKKENGKVAYYKGDENGNEDNKNENEDDNKENENKDDNKDDEREDKDDEKENKDDDKSDENGNENKDENININKRSNKYDKKNCKIYVKKWKRKCKDLPRVESVINAPLEYFYFRRKSYCLKNSQNRYCTIVMNEIKNRIYNETTKVSLPLTDQEKNLTCECYKEKMGFYNEEYISSNDTVKEKPMKYYSKNRKSKDSTKSETSQKKKRNLNTENKNEDNNNNNNKKQSNILWMHLENILSRYLPATFGIHRHQKFNYIPSFKDISEKVKNGKMKDYSFAEILAQEIEKILNPDSDIFNNYDSNNNNHKKVKRMQTTDNIQKLKKLMYSYETEMNEYMDISTCNVTFSELNSKDTLSNDALSIKSLSFYLLINQILISILFYLF